jgi:phage-related baseplate assembly protein
MALTVPVTLASLLTLPTQEEALEDVLTTFSDLKFRVTSWASVGLGRTVANHLARTDVQLAGSIFKLAAAGLLDTATGSWLTLLAKSAYDLDRTAAGYTVGDVKVTVASGASPITIVPGGMWVRDPSTGRRFQSANAANVVIGAGSSDYVSFKAESPGDDYNLGLDTITELVTTTFLGTTVTNDGNGTGEWVTTLGVDEESDADLRTRCRDRWSTLTANPPSEAYRTFAIGASSLITRAYVDASNPGGAGTIYVYLAGPSGAVTGTETTAADTVLQERKALNSVVTVYSATNRSCALTGTIYVEDGYDTGDVEAAVEEALDAYFQTIPIGGNDMNGTSKVWSALVAKAIQAVDGVALAQLTSGDFTMTATQVATVDYSALIYQAV